MFGCGGAAADVVGVYFVAHGSDPCLQSLRLGVVLGALCLVSLDLMVCFGLGDELVVRVSCRSLADARNGRCGGGSRWCWGMLCYDDRDR